jgi:hypothetical protein
MRLPFFLKRWDMDTLKEQEGATEEGATKKIIDSSEKVPVVSQQRISFF